MRFAPLAAALAVTLLTAFSAVFVYAQGVASVPPPSDDLGLVQGGDEPIHFTADGATADHKAGWVKLVGHVVVVQGESTLHCDELEIRYAKEEQGATPGGGSEQIREVIATGNVTMNQEDRNATCKVAHYFADTKKVVLTGDPTVWQEENRLTGDRIEIFLETDRVRVFGTEGRKVHGTIIPGDNSSFLDVLGKTPEKTDKEDAGGGAGEGADGDATGP